VVIRNPRSTCAPAARHELFYLAVSVVGVIAPCNALAQSLQGPLLRSDVPLVYDRGRNTSVLERERPEFETVGITAGAFRVLPRISAGIGYSDNVYAASNDRVSDLYAAVDPSVTVDSNWSVHTLSLNASGAFRRFADENSRNENAFRLSTAGRLDVSRAVQIAPSVSFQRGYEQPGSSGFPTDARELVRFNQTNTAVRGTFEGGRSRLTGVVDVQRVDFTNTEAFNGSLIDQDFRDRRDLRGTAQYEFAVTPDTAIYAQISYADIGYDTALTGGGQNRDGGQVRALAGASFDLTALLRGRVAIGYERRSFDSAEFPDFAGLSAEGRLEFFATELTTFSITGRRLTGESVLPGSGGFFLTSVAARVDHELRRDLLLNASVSYEHDDFSGIRRRDEIWSAQAGVNFFISRRVGLAANAFYVDRSSVGAFSSPSFDELRGSVSLVVQY
jgi:hypothetical protein